MPDINTNGLLPVSTNNTTWVAPTENFPVTLSNQQRGGVMVITGAAGDQLLNINGRLLQDGSIVFNQAQYTEAAGIVRAANTYFRYLSGENENRDAQGLMPNGSANWQALDTGGGGTGTFTPVADIAALDVLAATPPADEAEFTILDPTGAQNANPAIANLPVPVGGWTADLNLNVQWRAATADWLSLGFNVDNPDARYVNVVGDTMTGPLVIDNTIVDENALMTGEGHDIVLGVTSNLVMTGTDDTQPNPVAADITISAPNNAAGFVDYEVVLPPDQPTDANRLLRVSNVADQQGDIASPYTLDWAEEAATGVWTKTNTNLSPTTAGDDVLLNVNETLSFTGTDNTNPNPVTSTITFQAPTGDENFTADYTLTLPPNAGELNEVLQTNGAGVLDWATVSSSIDVEDSGTSVVATADTLNFTGTGVTVTDAGNNQANIAIAGGGTGPDDDPNWTAPAAAAQFAQGQMYHDDHLSFTPNNPIPNWATYGRGVMGLGDNTGNLQYGYSYLDARGLHWSKSDQSGAAPTYYNNTFANAGNGPATPQGINTFHQSMLYDGQMADLARRDPDNYGDWLLSAQDNSVLDPAPGRGYAMPRIRHYIEDTQNTYAITREGYAFTMSGYNGLGNCGDGTTISNYRWNMVAFYESDGTTLLTGPNKPRIRQIASSDCGGGVGTPSGYQNYFVSADNRLWVCGYDYYGQIGPVVAPSNSQTRAKELPLSLFGDTDGISAVFPSTDPGCYVLTVDGRLWYMGQNYSGQANNGQASAGAPANFVTTPYECTSNVNSSLNGRTVVYVLTHGLNSTSGGAHVLDSEGIVHFMGYSEQYGAIESIVHSGDPAQGTLAYAETVVNSVTLADAANNMNSDNQRVISMWGNVFYGGRFFITDGGDSGEPKVYTSGYGYNGVSPGVGKQNQSNPAVVGGASNYPIYANEVQFAAFGYMPGSSEGFVDPVVGTQWSNDVRARMDIGRIVRVCTVSDQAAYGKLTWFLDEHGRGYYCGYWPTTMTNVGSNINYCANGQDWNMNAMYDLPVECSYDESRPAALYAQSNYSFAIMPLANQPEPFLDIRAANGYNWNWDTYQVWQAVGASGTLWQGQGGCYGWNNTYDYSTGQDAITTVPAVYVAMGGWSVLNQENT